MIDTLCGTSDVDSTRQGGPEDFSAVVRADTLFMPRKHGLLIFIGNPGP